MDIRKEQNPIHVAIQFGTVAAVVFEDSKVSHLSVENKSWDMFNNISALFLLNLKWLEIFYLYFEIEF